MQWPSFEYTKLKPDCYRMLPNGQRQALYSDNYRWREHGQLVFKDTVQSFPEDLEEGPRREP